MDQKRQELVLVQIALALGEALAKVEHQTWLLGQARTMTGGKYLARDLKAALRAMLRSADTIEFQFRRFEEEEDSKSAPEPHASTH